MASPCRSSRLRAISKKRSRKPRERKPPTKAKPRRSLRALLRPLANSQRGKSTKTNLLSLPDELLTRIVSRLLPLTKSFKAPSAFFLAQTNTRFLHIFRSELTRITPDTSNPTPTTLSCDHLAAVSRLAGKYLKVIHLPEGALWPELADDCPNVEELSFRDDWRSQGIVRQLFEKLPLKVIEVVRPSPETVEFLDTAASRLEKLVLKDISLSGISSLLTILRMRPKEMVLEIAFISFGNFATVMKKLEGTVQQIEKLSVSAIPTDDPEEDIDWKSTVEQLRRSGREKTCKDIFLGGAKLFELLQHVDCKAKVALGSGGSVIRSDTPGDIIYASKLGIARRAMVNTAQVEELSIDTQVCPRWVFRLPPLKHVTVSVNHMLPPIQTEVATVPIPSKPYGDWNLPTRELRFTGRHLAGNEIAGVCEMIPAVLQRFKGETLWMEHIRGYDLPRDRDALRPYIRCAKYSCKCFEREGGDAGTVLAWLDDVFSRCF